MIPIVFCKMAEAPMLRSYRWLAQNSEHFLKNFFAWGERRTYGILSISECRLCLGAVTYLSNKPTNFQE